MRSPSRRDFLKMATTGLLGAAGLLGLGGFLRYLDYETDPPAKTVIDLGDASGYPSGSHTLVPEAPAVLIADKNGYTAISLVCTHLGCTVEQSENGFKCPCHGSRYDQQGALQRGPARLPLKKLRVELTPENHLLLHLV